MLNRSGVKIGALAGSSYVDFAKADYPNATIVLTDSWDESVRAVIRGEMMAVLYDQSEVANWLSANPEAGLSLQTVILKDRKDPLAFAVNRNDVHLLSWLNLYLEKKKMDGFLDELLQNYLYSEDWREKIK